MSNAFLESIMDDNYCRKLTICGSAKFRELKEKYQAYYTAVKGNLVFAPVNYLLIKEDNENKIGDAQRNAQNLVKIHLRKIALSEAIIIVTDDTRYFGSHTQAEIMIAYNLDKRILYTHINQKDKEKYYFNNDENYPLYMLKEV